MAITNHFKWALLDALLAGATVKVGLLDTSTSYTFNRDTDEFVSDIPTAAEPGDASYSRVTLSNASITQDNTDDEGVFDADDATFTSLTTTNDIQTVFVYIQIGGDDTTPGDDPLVLILDDDSGDSGGIADLPKATNGSDFIVSWNAEGIVNVT